ncbi:MAG: acyltransferase [Gammaproteobacteria bacterium]|nr:acyltransferase [Gammaproteobacteria bacterium]MDH5628748.1 acyltransferase [Gammaproteobacteria bacterium]
MLSKFLPAHLVGAISLSLHIINILIWVPLILLVALVKFVLPIKIITRLCNNILNLFASIWISFNTLIHRFSKDIVWEFNLPQNLSTNDWYLVVANHQSWADILALQMAFNRKIPFLKFFLKHQLIWIPVIGLAWWALDFPFMKRHSKSYLKKYPHRKGEDFKTTKKACEKFKNIPISVMNFLEGTRFTKAKQSAQKSPYKNLLKPKAGGVGYVLSLMGNEINKVINVTITYPQNASFSSWDFLCGKVKHVKLDAVVEEVPDQVRGNYIDDPKIRKAMQQWLNQLWQAKDKEIDSIMNQKSSDK